MSGKTLENFGFHNLNYENFSRKIKSTPIEY